MTDTGGLPLQAEFHADLRKTYNVLCLFLSELSQTTFIRPILGHKYKNTGFKGLCTCRHLLPGVAQ